MEATTDKYTINSDPVFFIKKTISNHYEININQIESKTRIRKIVQARQLIMFFTKKFTSLTLVKIGKKIGGKEHSTVLYSLRTVKNLSETNKLYKKDVSTIYKKLKEVFKYGIQTKLLL